MTVSEEGRQELGPYTEVADTLILAAVERAVLHEQEDEVYPMNALAEDQLLRLRQVLDSNRART